MLETVLNHLKLNAKWHRITQIRCSHSRLHVLKQKIKILYLENGSKGSPPPPWCMFLSPSSPCLSYTFLFSSSANTLRRKSIISVYTVQLRYIRTAHTHFIRAYFAYTRMSIRAHVRVYTRTYARIYARIWPFVMHSHKFLYLKHCLSNKGHLWE